MSHPEPVDSMMHPRYAGIATFMRLPLISDTRDLDVVFVGVPFDTSAGYRVGARLAPRAIRNCSSQVRTHHPIHDVTVHKNVRIADYGDVRTDPFDIAQTYAWITEAFDAIYATGCKAITVGGDHGITYPILRAVARHHGPLALVHIDAHTDTHDTQFGHKLTHATPFRRAHEEGLISPGKTVQLGIRGSLFYPDDLKWSKERYRLITADEIHRRNMDDVVAEVRDVVGGAPVYFTFDIDGMDPSCAPGTGVPEIGGLTNWQVMQIIRGLVGTNLVGADLVEVSPPCDTNDLTSITAAHMLFEIASVFAANKTGR
ncbi:MAG: agmatinase [Candidatus Rokubacteria bacterium]|nr:agmatinase [Candidatus Rokubacteria bacterium]